MQLRKVALDSYIGEDFLSFIVAHCETCVDSTYEGALSTPWGLSSSQLTRGFPLCLGITRKSFHDACTLLGICLKVRLAREFYWWLMVH